MESRRHRVGQKTGHFPGSAFGRRLAEQEMIVLDGYPVPASGLALRCDFSSRRFRHPAVAQLGAVELVRSRTLKITA